MSAQAAIWRRVIQIDPWPIALWAVLAGLLALVQLAAPGMVGGDDGYYHLKMAALMRTDLTPDFRWLPLTILNPADYVDHHWLFHVLLIPFTGGDLVLGGQVAAVVFAAAALAMAGGLLRAQRVPGAALWAIGIVASSSAFVYRMSMPRVQSLSLLWLLAAVHLLLQRRERWLVVLGLGYVWLYNAFPLLLAVAGIYLLAARLTEGEWRWGAVLYPAAGIALGLLIHPYFPQNLVFLYHHLAAKLTPTSVPVGNEWYPYTTGQLLANSGLAVAAMLAGAVGLSAQRHRATLPAVLTLGLALAFGVMLLQSRRFVEYFPPFAVLFCGVAWRPAPVSQAERDGDEPRSRGPGLAALTSIRVPSACVRSAAIIAALSVAVALSLRAARLSVSDDTPATWLAGAARWLAANTPEGSLVFQTDWDDFPRLFFYNTHNVYTVGLDPTYLQIADPSLYYLWVDLSKGRGLDVSKAIREHFGAEYVVSDLKHAAFLSRAAADPQLAAVYRDGESIVFKLTND